jgi:O-antigen ligase
LVLRCPGPCGELSGWAGDIMVQSKPFEVVFEKTLFFFLCASIALIGIGRMEIPFVDLPFRSWSVSRAAFFFWLIWRLYCWRRDKELRPDLAPKPITIPLFLFAGWVTVSLLPDFSHAGDYRYFILGVGHFLMVLDLFNDSRRRFLLYALLAMTPAILFFRGIIAEPAILNFSLVYRFAYPLDHANTAGYLFSMSIPLCLVILLSGGKWLQRLAIPSLIIQGIALILTFSRAAWIASCASLATVGVAEKRLRILVLIPAAVGLLTFAGSSELRERLWSLAYASQDPFVVYRADVMVNAFLVGVHNPVFGAGYGRDHLRIALKREHPEFDPGGFVGHSHNLYSELAAGIGVVGLAIFIAVLASAGIQLIRRIAAQSHSESERYADLGLLGALISFVIAALGDVPFYHHEPRIFFFTLLALICLRSRLSSGSQSFVS